MNQFNIRPAVFPAETERVRKMFRDYQQDIQVDLCFQSFEAELESLPGKYAVVFVADSGCVALRPMSTTRVEMKRLFVYPEGRGTGLGKALVMAALEWARAAGYQTLQLDTIEKKMPSAVALYRALGFLEISAPEEEECEPKLLYMELELSSYGA